MKKNANLENNLSSVPDQIDSFISSDTDPDATEFWETLDVLDNTSIGQKINLYRQDEHQSFADKIILANLEKQIHFLKSKLKQKMK